MARRSPSRERVLVAATFVSVYVGLVTLLTMATHGWFPVLTDTFCGSLGDFTNQPVPAVCLSFREYWLHALVHPPYALAGATLGAVAAALFAVRDWLRSKWPW